MVRHGRRPGPHDRKQSEHQLYLRCVTAAGMNRHALDLSWADFHSDTCLSTSRCTACTSACLQSSLPVGRDPMAAPAALSGLQHYSCTNPAAGSPSEVTDFITGLAVPNVLTGPNAKVQINPPEVSTGVFPLAITLEFQLSHSRLQNLCIHYYTRVLCWRRCAQLADCLACKQFTCSAPSKLACLPPIAPASPAG